MAEQDNVDRRQDAREERIDHHEQQVDARDIRLDAKDQRAVEAADVRHGEVFEHAEALLEANNQLEQRIDDKANAVIDDLVHYKKRSMRNTKLMAIVLMLVVVALGIQTYTLVKVYQNSATLRSQCESSNEARAGLARIFHFVEEVPPNTPLTAEQQQRRDDFFKLVATTTAQRDCSKPETP